MFILLYSLDRALFLLLQELKEPYLYSEPEYNSYLFMIKF